MDPLEQARRALGLGHLDQVVRLAEGVLRNRGPDPEALELLAEVGLRGGATDDATRLLELAAELAMDDARAQRRIGRRLASIGHPHRAAACLSRVAGASARVEQGRYLLDGGHAAAAAEQAAAALDEAPRADAWLLLGVARKLLGDLDAAVTATTQALALDPESIAGWVNLGNALFAGGDAEAAEDAFRTAHSLGDEPAARRGLSRCLVARGAWAEAEALFAARAPATLAERWDQLAVLPLAHEDVVSAAEARERFRERLVALDLAAGTEREAWEGARAVHLLHLLEGTHRRAQARHGRLLSRLGAARHPGTPAPRTPPGPPATTAPLRLGLVTSNLRDPPLTTQIHGAVERLDPERFTLRAYPVGGRTAACDGLTGHAEIVPQPRDADAVIARLRHDHLDAILFPQLGLDIVTLKVAAVRSAPLQACSWGHPVTTGLPTVDLFLSGAAYETPDHASHYTEELVLLPGGGAWLDAPDRVPPLPRAELGLPADVPLLLTNQPLVDLHPRYDRWYANLARAVPGARLVFLEHGAGAVTRITMERLSRAISRAGADPDQLLLLPRQPWRRFLALCQACDVLLDAPARSGGLSTLAAMSQGLVPVTRRGPVLRQRLAAGFLEVVGVRDVVVADAGPWVERATRLALDSGWRSDLQERMSRGLPQLLRDPTPVRALEALLLSRGS